MKNLLATLVTALAALISFPAWATESLDASTIPVTTATITDFFGHAWTLTQDTTRTVKRDGVATNMTDVQELWYLEHTVYAFNAKAGWYVFGPGSAVGVATVVANPLQFWMNMPKTPGTRAPVGPQTGGSCSGTNITSGQDIQTFVDANPANTIFCIGVGTYTAQSITPKSGQQFICAYSGGSGYALMDGNATAVRAFSGTADHVLIKNCKIDNYNTATQAGTVQLSGQYVQVQNNILSGSISGAGVHLDGNYQMIFSNLITLNAQEGYAGGGVDAAHSAIGFLFDNNNFVSNNPSFLLWDGSEQGIGKLTFTDSSTLWYNSSTGNGGQYWTDANNIDTKYWFNSGVDDGGGIEHEISYNASIIGNSFTNIANDVVFSGCPGFFVACGGVMIENSQGISPPNPRAGIIEVAYNTIKPGKYGRSITFRDQDRGSTVLSDGWFAVGPLISKNTWVHHNLIDMTDGTDNADQVGIGSPVVDTSIFFYGNIKFNFNSYVTNGSTPFLWDLGAVGFSAWQAAGNDINGQVVTP